MPDRPEPKPKPRGFGYHGDLTDIDLMGPALDDLLGSPDPEPSDG
jgi:hypothetical protein